MAAKITMLQSEGEAAFVTLKGEVERTQRPTNACLSWISHETWRLSNRWTALLITGRASATDAAGRQTEEIPGSGISH